jgi:dCTP deaminase
VSILTHDEILGAVAVGAIRIEPFDPDCVGPASVDLHLGNEFRVFRKAHAIIRVEEDTDYEAVTEKIVAPEGLILMPGETVLALTRERITLAPNLCGWLEGRSRFARLGLLVHVSASFMHPGIANQQCLEMSNFSPMPLSVTPGVRICQFVFQRTIGEARYTGRFRDQGNGKF